MTARLEYQVFTLGKILRGVKDEELAAALNQLANDGWEIVSVGFPQDGKPRIVARRPLSDKAKRQRSWPGENTAS